MWKIIGYFLTGVIVVMLSAGNVKAMETITIAGDPCTVPLAEKLGEAFTKKTGTDVKVSSSGCMSGVFKVSNGEVNIGVSTQNMDPKALPAGTTNTIIAKAPIVMIVNKANPVNNLTLAQLKGILSGRIKNWKAVGGKDIEIKNVMLQPCVMMTMSKQASAYGSDIKKLAPEKKGNPVTGSNRMVESDAAAIGQQLYGYESGNVKVVTIDGYLPDEKPFPGKYGFYEDYNVVTNEAPATAVKAFVDFAMSPEGQAIVSSMKHIRMKK